MKRTLSIVGIILIIVGILTLFYQGYTYTKHEKVAQLGDIQVTADTKETVYFSPIWGGVSLAVGIVLVVIARNNKA
ncbi:MAG: DUF3185 domain-containing protein [Gammaproteobacteria bacterium]|nr:DUF3185 domain-containing protein [Gammaproteobacteria bacterium]